MKEGVREPAKMIDPTNEIAAPEAPRRSFFRRPARCLRNRAGWHRPQNHGSRIRLWTYAVIALALFLGVFSWFRGHGSSPARAKTAKSGKGKKDGAPAVTPVVAVKATKGNIGVYVTGLGA